MSSAHLFVKIELVEKKLSKENSKGLFYKIITSLDILDIIPNIFCIESFVYI